MTKATKKTSAAPRQLASSDPEGHLQAITDARAEAAAATATLTQVNIQDLRVAPWNARKTFDAQAMADFTANIQLHGIQVPLIVRQLRDYCYVSPGPDSSPLHARYVASKSFDGSENLLQTFSSGTEEENQESAQLNVDLRNASGAYEIVAGHRRFKAAQALRAGDLRFESLPCIVRELTDEQAREVGLVDNLQRENVPALEEALAFAELRDALGGIAAIAARVGKEASYIAKRLKLLELTLWSQEALRERLITLDHAMLLARLGEREQNEALKWTIDRNAGSKVPVEKVIADRLARRKGKKDQPGTCRVCGCTHEDPCNVPELGGSCSWANTEQTLCNNPECLEEAGQGDRRPSHRYTWEPESVQRLKDYIETESGIPLSRAPWVMGEDWLLLDTPSCLDCPKNTKANAPLFADLDMGEPICTDGACFKAKTEAFVQLQLGDAAKDLAQKLGRASVGDVEVLRVSWNLSSTVPRQLKDGGGVNPAQIFKAGQWKEVEAKKSCEHTQPAVTVDWDDSSGRGYMGRDEKLRKPGEIVQACIQPKCKVHPKSYEKAKGAAGRAEREDPAAAKKRQEEEEFLGKEEKQIRAKVFTAILKAVECLDLGAALRVINDSEGSSPAVRKELFGAFPKLSGAALEALTAFVNKFERCRRVNGYWIQQDGAARDRKEAWSLAKLVGVDANAIAAKHFHDAGSIAPWADKLYPKGIKWPKKDAAAAVPAKKAAKKAPAKSAAKKALKKKPAANAKKKAVSK
jgi:ParB/RepB/Spo0J family partition protein